jgi:glycerol-3-phosphate dehydrogenase
MPTAVARPEWSTLAGRDKSKALSHAWTRRYAALVPAVEELCGRVEAGRRALDDETLLGEVDWAVRFEDCLGIEDFLMRRTDLGYGRRQAVEALAPDVLERLADKLGWTAERRGREKGLLDAALDRIHRWRSQDRIARPA